MVENTIADGQDKHQDLCVVGLGASAGGLEALEDFFDAMPDSPGMAFVIVIHLSPDHDSSMAELLQDHTSLQVSQITEKTKVEPDHVYIIPPGKLLTMEDRHLVLSDVDKKDKKLATIDLFFRSLGKAMGSNSACIILSGTGSDGIMGLKTIKEHGGIVIAQDPAEAAYDSMPYNAIQTGLVDVTLPVKEMPAKLKAYEESLREIKLSETGDLPESETKILSKIFGKIKVKTSHDFTQYKRSSVLRRIERRMRVNRIGSLSDYLDYITEHPPEIQELFKDLLISVTNFFRDRQAFEKLQEIVVPKLFEGKGSNDSVRVWVPGCATGEEAYSIAILLHEYAQTIDNPPTIKIFATDIDKEALQVARKGCYPESIETDMTRDRLQNYFTKEGSQYRVRQNISGIVLLAVHNLLADPPFSKLDLVSCRNLLIYLNRDLQSEVFNLFHYALKPDKWLFLGMSDSILEATDLFNAKNSKYQIFQQNTVSKSQVQLPRYPLSRQDDRSFSNRRQEKHGENKSNNIEDLHYRLLVNHYEPASVIINQNHEVLHATSDIDRFLKYSGGEPSKKILDMVIPELRKVLSRQLFQVKQDRASITSQKVKLDIGGEDRYYRVSVRRIAEPNIPEGLLHITFLEDSNSESGSQHTAEIAETASEEDADIIEALEEELEHTKERLHVTIEEYETSNEELQASNEELQSMNEELRSTTEQLETSREELQSVNEELKSVNTELEHKIENLNEANSNLQNLMESTDIATLFIDSKNCVQFFTSSSTDIFNLIPSDAGRPFSHVSNLLDYNSIQDDIDQVKESLQPIKKIVPDERGHHYIMRIRPYRTINDKIDGVVLTLVDITQLKKAEEQIKERARRQKIISEFGLFALQEENLQTIIGEAMEILGEITNLPYCLVFESYPQTASLKLMGSNVEDAIPNGTTIELDPDWDVNYALKHPDPLIVKDYREEPRFSIMPLLDDFEIVFGMQINIVGKEEDFGVLSLYDTSARNYSKHEVNFVQIIANIIGSAIERNRAAQKLQDEVERSTELQKQILSNSLAERWELGGYLHDNLAQILVSIKIIVNDLKSELSSDSQDNASSLLDEINSLIDLEIDNIRDLSHDIVPIDVEEEGVSHAFSLLIRRSQKIHDVTCTLESDQVLDKINNREMSSNLYHITQEAIKNAANHGEANNILVSLSLNDGQMRLEIKDDGKGFSPQNTTSKGMGLQIIGHRVDLLGGTFSIDRLPESDEYTTRVRCDFPEEAIKK